MPVIDTLMSFPGGKVCMVHALLPNIPLIPPAVCQCLDPRLCLRPAALGLPLDKLDEGAMNIARHVLGVAADVNVATGLQ